MFLNARLLQKAGSVGDIIFSICLPMLYSLGIGLHGGHSRPGDGFPAPSLKGLALNPDWTISSRDDVSRRSWGMGRVVGLSDVCCVCLSLPARVPSWTGHAFRMVDEESLFSD